MSNYEEGINAMWEEFKKEFYGTNCCAQTKWGIIDFNPESVKEIAGGEKLTYDEYLEIMKNSVGKARHYFELCYYDCGGFVDCKGQIEKKSKSHVCFKRIFVSGMYMDGTFLDGKEDHVWMNLKGFEEYKVGDCLSFSADVYRYLKTSKGKSVDFGLRDPQEICRIESYELPSDDELIMQSVDQIICESCMFNEHCYMGMCLANQEWRDNMRKILFDTLKNQN